MNNNELNLLLRSVEYDQNEEAPLEQVVFKIQFKDIGSLGDFVLFSGRPKSGKSKYISAAIAASLSNKTVFDLLIRLPQNQLRVAHFDTEQSKYSHYKMMRLVQQLGGLEVLPENFHSYRCRKIAPHQIIALVDFFVKQNKDTGIIFLDGLLDIVTSMNDEKHSNMIKGWLKRITEENNILLIGVIHRGFSNDKSIGQIGSEGERAAQSVLMVETNKETKQYILTGEYLRDTDAFEPIAIHYNKQMSLWEQCEYYGEAPVQSKGYAKRKPNEYDFNEHLANSVRIFNSTSVQSYKNLCQMICEVYGVGAQWAKQCVSELVRENIIFRIDEGYTNVRQTSMLKLIE